MATSDKSLADRDLDNEDTFGMLDQSAPVAQDEKNNDDALDQETFGGGSGGGGGGSSFSFSDRDLLSEFDRLADRAANFQRNNAFMLRTHEPELELPHATVAGEIGRSKTGQDVLPQEDLRGLLRAGYDFVEVEPTSDPLLGGGGLGLDLDSSLFGFLDQDSDAILGALPGVLGALPGLESPVSPPAGVGSAAAAAAAAAVDDGKQIAMFIEGTPISVDDSQSGLLLAALPEFLPEPAHMLAPPVPAMPPGVWSEDAEDGGSMDVQSEDQEEEANDGETQSPSSAMHQIRFPLPRKTFAWMSTADIARVLKSQFGQLLAQTSLDDDAYAQELAQRMGQVVPPPSASAAALIKSTKKHILGLQKTPVTTSLLTSAPDANSVDAASATASSGDNGAVDGVRSSTNALAKSLGALQFSSLRQPRKMLALSSLRSTTEADDNEDSEQVGDAAIEQGMFSGRTLQYLVEEGLRELLVIEDVDRMLRQVDGQLRSIQQRFGNLRDGIARIDDLRAQHAKLLRQRHHLVSRLCFQLDMYDEDTGEAVQFDDEHVILLFLSIPKGRLLVYRALLVLPRPASLQLATLLLRKTGLWMQPQVWSEFCDPFLGQALARSVGQMDMVGVNHAFFCLLFQQQQQQDRTVQALKSWIQRVIRSQGGSAVLTAALQVGFGYAQYYHGLVHEMMRLQSLPPGADAGPMVLGLQQRVAESRPLFETWKRLYDIMIQVLMAGEESPGAVVASLLTGLRSKSGTAPSPPSEDVVEDSAEQKFGGVGDFDPAASVEAAAPPGLAPREAVWAVIAWMTVHSAPLAASWVSELSSAWQAHGRSTLQALLSTPQVAGYGPNGQPMFAPPPVHYDALWRLMASDPLPQPQWPIQAGPGSYQRRHPQGGPQGPRPGHHGGRPHHHQRQGDSRHALPQQQPPQPQPRNDGPPTWSQRVGSSPSQ